MIEAAFRGFMALPEPGRSPARTWYQVLGFQEGAEITIEMIKYRFRELAMQHHPDKPGGSHKKMQSRWGGLPFNDLQIIGRKCEIMLA